MLACEAHRILADTTPKFGDEHHVEAARLLGLYYEAVVKARKQYQVEAHRDAKIRDLWNGDRGAIERFLNPKLAKQRTTAQCARGD